MSRMATFYFDVISHYTYLAFKQLPALEKYAQIEYRPVLFAGFLNHYGHKGPAEIESKRRFTFKHTAWMAERMGIPYKQPPAHPFNPLRALRLLTALGPSREQTAACFHAIWVEGHLPDDAEGWEAIQKAVGCTDGDSLINDPVVKAELVAAGEQAISDGAFGVPTIVIDDNIFWGLDALPMAQDYLEDPTLFDRPELRVVDDMPFSARRPQGQ